MGKQQSKVENPSANVINEVEIMQENNLYFIEICLALITILVILDSILRIISFHNKRLKKKYTNRISELDRS